MTAKKEPAPKRLENEEERAARKSAPIEKSTPHKQVSAKYTDYIQLKSNLSESLAIVPANEKTAVATWNKPGAPKSYVTLEFDEDSFTTNKALTPAHKAVYCAVASLVYAGITYFTPRQVWQVWTGKNENPGKAALERVVSYLDFMKVTMATFDIAEELATREDDMRYQGEKLDPYVRENLLYLREVGIKTPNGREVMGYQVLCTPFLLAHDTAAGQLITMEHDLLEATSKANPCSPRNLLLRDYLYRRIMQHEGGVKKAWREVCKTCKVCEIRLINFTSIFKAAGYEEPDVRQAEAMTKAAIRYLDAYKEEGLIAAWDYYQSKPDKAAGRNTGVCTCEDEAYIACFKYIGQPKPKGVFAQSKGVFAQS